MGYPELDQDESIILETRNVKFKSISLDAILTNKRIILIDNKKNVLPPQDIPLASIRIVEMGENAIRDPFLLLILSTVTGEKHQLVITFSRLAGAERKRECNEWVKKLDSLREAMIPDSYPADIPVLAEEPEIPPEVPAPAPAPAPAPTRTVIAGTRPVKKKIEISRPLSKIIEKSPVSPVPVETSSLPSGTFCSRCGNRVPLNSTFCNHCGTPIVHVPEKAAAPQPSAPSVKVMIQPPVSSPAEQQNRPIDRVIHSIEPLIEDSVPRTQSAPLVQKNAPEHKAEPPLPAPPVPASPVPEPQEDPTPQVNWPVLSTAGSPMVPAEEAKAADPEIPPPPPAPVPEGRKPDYRMIALVGVAIIAIIIGIVLLPGLTSSPAGGTGSNLTTTAITTPATPYPTTIPKTPVPVITATIAPAQVTVLIPQNGVWVRVTYPGTFTGSIGMPNDLHASTDSGDRFYQISTTNGTVAVSLKKTDGSSDKLNVEIYKNGVLVKQASTIAPKGELEFQFDLKTVSSGGTNATTPAK